MFTLIKTVVWIVGTIVVGNFALSYFGYEVNKNYFHESKEKCMEELKVCRDKYIHEGVDNAKCEFECVDPKLIIQKK